MLIWRVMFMGLNSLGDDRMLDELTDSDIKRIQSWLNEACNMTDNDFFKKMIFCWIAFNVYYGARYLSNNGKKQNQDEPAKIRHVLSQTLTESNARGLLNECSSNIDVLLEKPLMRTISHIKINTAKYIRKINAAMHG
jgi:hypothetical protein